MFFLFVACIPTALIAHDANLENLMTCLIVFIKFCTSVIFFAINLQSMEVYPTCLRQSGIAAGAIVANIVAMLGPYIVYLGTEFDVRYPFIVLGMAFNSIGSEDYEETFFKKNSQVPWD